LRNTIQPGDKVQVAKKTAFEPLARVLREKYPNQPFIVETVQEQSLCRYPVYGDSTYTVVTVRYPDGLRSGALYASIFEKTTS
jgi:hypothetical protein